MANQRSDSKPNTKNEMPAYSSFTTTSPEYAHELYRKVAEDSDIEEYLAESNVFNTETSRWAFCVGLGAKEALVKSVHNIVGSIVSRFVKTTQPGVSRRAVNVHGLRGNTARDEDGYSPYSDLVIRASGPSFEDPIPANDSGTTSGSRIISFSNVSSCVAIKLDSTRGTAEDDVKEMENCARCVTYSPACVCRISSILQAHLRLAAQSALRAMYGGHREECSHDPLRSSWRPNYSPHRHSPTPRHIGQARCRTSEYR